MRGRTPPEQALHGPDGRIVFADLLSERVFERLRPELRRHIAGQLARLTGYRMVVQIDMPGIRHFTSGTFTINDCVASCDLAFGKDGQTVATGTTVTSRGILPDTIMMGARGRDMADVTGIELLRGVTVAECRPEDGHTVFVHDGGIGYLDMAGRGAVDHAAAPC